MGDYPVAIVPINHVEPVPRRVRAFLADVAVVDTLRALYVWEWPYYPQYYIPVADVNADVLADDHRGEPTPLGTVRHHSLRVGDTRRDAAARLLSEATPVALNDTVRFEWEALDRWFEEDEEVFVHPRNPYCRVDALRSTRHVRVELDGAVLADSSSPVMVFETGLPTRYYLNRTDVHAEHLVGSDTVTACPYKGRTSEYWSVRVGDTLHADLAWAYNFPTRQLLPVTGLIAFYNEKVDITIDGQRLPRPETHFFT